MTLEGKALGVEEPDTFERHGERQAFLQLKAALARHTQQKERVLASSPLAVGTTYTTKVVARTRVWKRHSFESLSTQE